MGTILLSKAIEGFLISRAAEGYSPETLKIYKWALSASVEFLNDPDVKTITCTDLQSFYAYLQTEYVPRRMSGDTSPLKPRSVENAWTAIRSFYNWCSSELGIKKRPDSGLKKPRYQPAEIAPLSADEIKSLLKACERTKESNTHGRRAFSMRRPTASRDVAIMMVLLDTGLRVSECARLRFRDVNFETGEVFVAPFSTGRKTKSRHVYLGKATCKALWRYVAERQDTDQDSPLFVSQDNRPMDRNNIRLMLSAAGERAQVKKVHPHRFRHTFAIQYLRNGGDVFTLQRLLGHSSLEMVQHYLTLADTDSRSAHRKASPVDRWYL